MHIIIALLSAAAGLIWALWRLQNSGVDLNAFNPFYWARRRKWEKQLGTRPLHRIGNSMECAAVLVVAMAEAGGSVTRETRQGVLDQFVEQFGISGREAADQYASASHMLRDVVDIAAEVRLIMAPTLASFEARHQEIMLTMLNQVMNTEGDGNDTQQRLLDAVQRQLGAAAKESPTRW